MPRRIVTRGRQTAAWVCVMTAMVLGPVTARAAQVRAPDESGDAPAPAVEPAAPAPPSVIARDDQGRVTVRAERLDQPLVLDGVLDEAAYLRTPPFGGFIQQEPNAGQPATERSEVWVFFDERAVYVSARFWKSDPSDLIANEMRKDDSGIFRNDSIGVVLDTFLDRRSGYYFNTNALGAVRDALLVNENQNANLDFNPVWDVRSRTFDQGWTTEMVIPFQSLRFPEGRTQVWGLLVQRIDWKKNELSYLTAIPPSWGGAGIWKVSSAATLVGIEAPARARRLEVKPYVVSSATTDRLAMPQKHGDLSADAGVDARYRLTRNLNVDFTYNTDFAQVEVDNQQVNLSRFSLFFPEKREFFLEMQNTLGVGASGPGGGRGAGDPTPLLYFSRRIGLADGVTVPIVAGGRLLGRAGEYSLGAFTMRTADSDRAGAPGTTFSVGRVRRNVFRRSSIGALVTHRSVAASGAGDNRVAAVDALLRFYENVEVNAFYAASGGSEAASDSTLLGQFRYAGDRWGVEATRLHVGRDFDAGIGFVPRRGITRNYGFFRFSPRPARLAAIRKFSWEGSVDRIGGTGGGLETLQGRGVFRIQQNNGDEFNVDVTDTEDHPRQAFVAAGAPIAAGAYRFRDVRVNYVLGPQQPIVGNLSVSRGGFYGGTKTEAGYNGRVSLSSRLLLEPSVSWTALDLPSGSYRARLLGVRATVALTPRMFTTALVQHSSVAGTLGANVRFRWEYRPGSDLFVVFSEGRDTGAGPAPGLLNRSVTVKFTRLLWM
ncbi:MAG: DUF5916 domain-containing protein [Vicinamibacterales bacterium]